uniref:ChSh domain-containing protein n=1 Tax=Angiostrongylus cantonensis TaxID=6313 RepID=A0A0K0CT83_ANGCA
MMLAMNQAKMKILWICGTAPLKPQWLVTVQMLFHQKITNTFLQFRFHESFSLSFLCWYEPVFNIIDHGVFQHFLLHYGTALHESPLVRSVPNVELSDKASLNIENDENSPTPAISSKDSSKTTISESHTRVGSKKNTVTVETEHATPLRPQASRAATSSADVSKTDTFTIENETPKSKSRLVQKSTNNEDSRCESGTATRPSSRKRKGKSFGLVESEVVNGAVTSLLTPKVFGDENYPIHEADASYQGGVAKGKEIAYYAIYSEKGSKKNIYVSNKNMRSLALILPPLDSNKQLFIDLRKYFYVFPYRNVVWEKQLFRTTTN